MKCASIQYGFHVNVKNVKYEQTKESKQNKNQT